MSSTREEIDDLIHRLSGDDSLGIFWEAINRLVEEEKESALAAARQMHKEARNG